MPITRLDMISMAPKTQEAGTHKQQEVQHPTNQQHNIAGNAVENGGKIHKKWKRPLTSGKSGVYTANNFISHG